MDRSNHNFKPQQMFILTEAISEKKITPTKRKNHFSQNHKKLWSTYN
jgi:hypothetical protein